MEKKPFNGKKLMNIGQKFKSNVLKLSYRKYFK